MVDKEYLRHVAQRGLLSILTPAERLAVRGARKELIAWKQTRRLNASIHLAQPYTMTSEKYLVTLGRITERVLTERVPGDFVECGVWRGGSALLMADLLRRHGIQDRKVWLFDSFQGLPPPDIEDGQRARAYHHEAAAGLNDNCEASLEEVQHHATKLGLTSYLRFVKGWFDESLPANRDCIGPIALLRIDADWQASVRCCLDNLYDQISRGGFVILDDYHYWQGCALATHEFLGERHLAHRMEDLNQCSFFRKLAGDDWHFPAFDN